MKVFILLSGEFETLHFQGHLLLGSHAELGVEVSSCLKPFRYLWEVEEALSECDSVP